ncbi:MAG: arsenate reductase (glutaredoxin) [Rhodospirillaceae bacterium]|nr:arsenate reductase (glutaredoxin) [Rhodospirillaceae bacterium]
MTVTIYHNPRCSKSRTTLALLQSRGIEPAIRLYLDEPPSAARLDEILKLLDLEPRALMRRQEPPYKEAGLDDPALTRKQLIAAMVQHPILIERPIVVVEKRGHKKAALGRPPEAALDIL